MDAIFWRSMLHDFHIGSNFYFSRVNVSTFQFLSPACSSLSFSFFCSYFEFEHFQLDYQLKVTKKRHNHRHSLSTILSSTTCKCFNSFNQTLNLLTLDSLFFYPFVSWSRFVCFQNIHSLSIITKFYHQSYFHLSFCSPLPFFSFASSKVRPDLHLFLEQTKMQGLLILPHYVHLYAYFFFAANLKANHDLKPS